METSEILGNSLLDHEGELLKISEVSVAQRI